MSVNPRQRIFFTYLSDKNDESYINDSSYNNYVFFDAYSGEIYTHGVKFSSYNEFSDVSYRFNKYYDQFVNGMSASVSDKTVTGITADSKIGLELDSDNKISLVVKKPLDFTITPKISTANGVTTSSSLEIGSSNTLLSASYILTSSDSEIISESWKAGSYEISDPSSVNMDIPVNKSLSLECTLTDADGDVKTKSLSIVFNRYRLYVLLTQEEDLTVNFESFDSSSSVSKIIQSSRSFIYRQTSTSLENYYIWFILPEVYSGESKNWFISKTDSKGIMAGGVLRKYESSAFTRSSIDYQVFRTTYPLSGYARIDFNC